MHITHHIINKNTFLLSVQRCLFWEEEKTLIVSDLHFGKTGHFRKNGIAVPQFIYKEDLQRLVTLITFYKTQRIIVVGDMFHSHENKELELFVKWRKDLNHVHIHLVKGNHDIIETGWYKKAGIELSDELEVNGFRFIHDINTASSIDQNNYYFSGHFHPSVILKGTGKQSLRFHCFYFGKDYAVLPAFSKFSGVTLIEPKKNDHVYAIVESSNICVKV